MGNCLWGVRRLRKGRIRDQKRKIEQKQYLQELEIDKFREEEVNAKRRLVQLADDEENTVEHLQAVAGDVIEAQDKQERGHGVLELLRGVKDRIDLAQQTEEVRTVVMNSANAAFRVRAAQPPPEIARYQMAQAANVLRAAPTQPAPLPDVRSGSERRGRILINNRRDDIIRDVLRSSDDSSSDGDADLQQRLERLRNED